jgi:hypothetical protein
MSSSVPPAKPQATAASVFRCLVKVEIMYAHATHIADDERKNRSHRYAREECEALKSSSVPHKAEEAFERFRCMYDSTVVVKDQFKSFSNPDQAKEEFDVLESPLLALRGALLNAECEMLGGDFAIDGYQGNGGDSLAPGASAKVIPFLELSFKIARPVEETHAYALSQTVGTILPFQNDIIMGIVSRKSFTFVYVHQGSGLLLLKVIGCLRICRLRLLRRKA